MQQKKKLLMWKSTPGLAPATAPLPAPPPTLWTHTLSPVLTARLSGSARLDGWSWGEGACLSGKHTEIEAGRPEVLEGKLCDWGRKYYLDEIIKDGLTDRVAFG